MRSGAMRHRFAIEENNPSENAHGDDVDNWEKVVDWWGDLKPMRATEVVQANTFEGRVTHKITMRHWAGLGPMHRLVDTTGRIFNIDGVINVDERNRFHEVMAVEQV